MKLPRHRTRRWQAWLAILALVFQSLLPALAQAASAQGGHAIEICTAQGLKTLQADEGQIPDQPTPAAHAHCLLCKLSGNQPLPPAPDIGGLSLGPVAALPLPPAPATPAALPAAFFTVLVSRAPPPTLS